VDGGDVERVKRRERLRGGERVKKEIFGWCPLNSVLIF
tara:strand:- start:321 stop:434 length:114 start_codon:yes stop_codon:yes gene_type:complete